MEKERDEGAKREQVGGVVRKGRGRGLRMEVWNYGRRQGWKEGTGGGGESRYH